MTAERAQTTQTVYRWAVSESGEPSSKTRGPSWTGHTTVPCQAALLVPGAPMTTLCHVVVQAESLSSEGQSLVPPTFAGADRLLR